MTKERRGWVLAGVVLVAVALLGATAGCENRDEVRTKKLVIEDEKGEPRAVLTAAKGGPAPGGVYTIHPGRRARDLA